jgi:hypothetical protein
MRVLYARGASCFKDPRFCYTLPAWWGELPASERREALHVCVFRDPAVVTSSVLRELRTAPYLQGLQFDAAAVQATWAQQYRHVLERLRHEGHWLFVHYDTLFEAGGLDRLAEFTGLFLDRELVDPNLRRSRAEVAVEAACVDLYGQLLALAEQEG